MTTGLQGVYFGYCLMHVLQMIIEVDVTRATRVVLHNYYTFLILLCHQPTSRNPEYISA